MYEEHPTFSPPPPDAVLWRYMDFTKFVSFIDKKALFFARADKLGDPYEGSTSHVNIALQPILYKDSLHSRALEQLPAAMRSLRRFHLVNCWHWNDHESDAMWTRYAKEFDGIAIKTNFQTLRDSFTGSVPIYIGTVSYVDYDTTFIPEGNLFSMYLHKRRAFEHEREVRAMALEMPPEDVRAGIQGVENLPDICDVGKYLDVDISRLIHEIVVAPFVPDWFIELVQSVSAQYHIEAPVTRSSLSTPPVWG